MEDSYGRKVLKEGMEGTYGRNVWERVWKEGMKGRYGGKV